MLKGEKNWLPGLVASRCSSAHAKRLFPSTTLARAVVSEVTARGSRGSSGPERVSVVPSAPLHDVISSAKAIEHRMWDVMPQSLPRARRVTT
jgi:hypothetical protein